jgi:hypothetical protein
MSLIPVNSSDASSKLPSNISNVSDQPEPKASAAVPTNCVNVLTLVAASSAVLACSTKPLIVASDNPRAAISASDMSPAIILR